MFDVLIRNCDVLHVKDGKVWIDIVQDIGIVGQRIVSIVPSPADLPEASSRLSLPLVYWRFLG